MKVRYDKETDILVVTFSEGPVAESDEKNPGMILDYDKNGSIVSIEIMDASERVSNPEKVEILTESEVQV